MMTDQPNEGNKRIVLAVDLDYFFAQCEEIRRPEIREKPVVICVFSGRTSDSGAVSTSNYVARALGVRSGNPIVSAKKILKDNKDAVFLPLDKEYYESVSSRIMDILRSESDKFQQMSIDEAFLDISARSSLDYSKSERMGEEIKEKIFGAEGLTCTVGIAPNKILAKMAADFGKPNGLFMIKPNEVQGFLREMHVTKLPGIGPKTEEKLSALGVTKIEQLANFDESKLAEEFGKNLGPHLKRIAKGVDDDPVLEREVEQLSRIITLKSDATEFDFKEQLEPLAKDISERLKAMDYRCRTVGIIAITSEIRTKNRARTLGMPTDSERDILVESTELFKEFFESEKKDGKTKIRRVGVRVSGLEKADGEKDSDQSTKDGDRPAKFQNVSASLTDYF